jgi:hypothetical protein
MAGVLHASAEAAAGCSQEGVQWYQSSDVEIKTWKVMKDM